MLKLNVRGVPLLVSMFVVLASSTLLSLAQEVAIPDPGLNAAVRDALQKPVGPLTEQDMLGLTQLSAGGRNISSLEGLETARNLAILDLDSNSLTNFLVADALTNLTILDLFGNHLVDFVLSNAPPGLTILDIAYNSLAHCSLPAGMTNLDTLFLEGNSLTNFNVPAGLANLTQLDLSSNQLTSLTLPPDLTQLGALFLDGNPLTTLVLSELLATNLQTTITALESNGVSVFTYPLTPQLVRLRPLTSAMQLGIKGPPGIYTVFGSTNLISWVELGTTSNGLGSVNFVDVTAHLFSTRFYRTLLQEPPPNMVFIPAGTFVMGSPTNELHRDVNEGPQTTVTLTHSFWIGKYEVTEGEYLGVTGTNPSFFPGDLSRPVSGVSWPDATNYCALLTARERAAGRISPSSVYRLPTEAEWEYAARAGTSTRFSYGDDLDYSSLTNYAWYYANGDFTVHPVGRKLPNPWGLYDMEGNVWEWTQDWLGDLPGGSVTDPQGPLSNPIGWKVIRGGGYDFSESDCRSARRYFYGNHPALHDTNLGFRVVLATGP